MKNYLVSVLSLLLILLAVTGCASQSKPPAEPAPTALAVASTGTQAGGPAYGGQIIAEGQVVPA